MNYIRTEEHREKMRLLKIGGKHSKETRDKISINHADVSGENNPMWGKKRPQSVKDAISRANSGKKHINYVKPMLGRKHKIETIMKMREAQRGEKGNNWQGGLTEKHKLIRTTSEYRIWRVAVFTRDDYTCQMCFERGGTLQADHIKPLSKYPELVYAIDNGRTLCISCHKNTETYGFKMMRA